MLKGKIRIAINDTQQKVHCINWIIHKHTNRHEKYQKHPMFSQNTNFLILLHQYHKYTKLTHV